MPPTPLLLGAKTARTKAAKSGSRTFAVARMKPLQNATGASTGNVKVDPIQEPVRGIRKNLKIANVSE